MKQKLLFTAFIVFIVSPGIWAQVGAWTNYQAYQSAEKVIDAGEIVYCSGTGGLFSYNKNDHSIEKLSRINGLSDVGISTIAYGNESDIVLIAYNNSNIDLIIDNNVYNISDIKRKQILGDKRINSIFFDKNLAYLSCGFGIVVINVEKQEIKDTWYIASGGDYINVYDLTSDENNLYAATEHGIYYASISEPNLQDYSNWHHDVNVPNANGTFTQIENQNGQIITCYSPATGSDELYRLENNKWTRVFSSVNEVYDMTVALDKRLLISNGSDLYIFAEDGSEIEKVYQYTFYDSQSNGIYPRSAVFDKDGSYWIADNEYGLVHKSGSSYEKLTPAGPVDNKVFSLYQSGNDLWLASGGRNAAWGNLWNQIRVQRYSENTWTVFDQQSYPEMANLHDAICVVTAPDDPEHVFIGCWGGGIFEFKNDQLIEQYSYNNSSLQTVIAGSNYVSIGGMAFDNNGTLWVNNGGVAEPLSSFKDEKWTSYNLTDINGTPNFGDIVITDNGDKWIALSNRNKDIYVVKGDNEAQRLQSNIAYFTNGTDETFLPMHEVYCMTLDQDGAIWVGSSAGIAVYNKPSQIWETTDSSPLYAEQPGLDMNDGIYHPLLQSETVTAIAVDGANQKWCGTKNNGIFLISEDGKKELEHFTSENSPLLADEITALAVNNNSGEVFIGTSEGLISYMGIATKGNDQFTDVYVYPNPVRETYSGPIIITGLMTDTDVKITDISGNLVYHDTSVGGQISWDGTNQKGNRCHTGVYLVFLNDKTGEQTFVTKLLFIH